jgi:hypothetical protein
MFDLKTFQTLGRIPAAEDPDGVLYDRVSNRVFTLTRDAPEKQALSRRSSEIISRSAHIAAFKGCQQIAQLSERETA